MSVSFINLLVDILRPDTMEQVRNFYHSLWDLCQSTDRELQKKKQLFNSKLMKNVNVGLQVLCIQLSVMLEFEHLL
jgi:4-hydroxyphenylpyruvate dioxygenase-like putative hemolysin